MRELGEIISVKKVNTPDHIHTPDEDRHKRSEHGKQMEQKQTFNTAKQKTSTKRERLLANPDVKRWYDNISRSSFHTAETRVRKLGNFCEQHNMTPIELAELGMKDTRAVSDLLQDHITSMEEKGKAPQYIKSVITSIKSWLAHFDVNITRKLKISNVESTPTLEDERVPEGHEMAEILDRADLRTATAISLIAKAGLRPETLCNYDGSDGLTMKDLPDIVIQQGVARSLRSPPRIHVRRTLSKARHQYFTMLTSGGTKKLLAYFNDRLARGETLNADSPVISPDNIYGTNRGRNCKKRFLPTSTVLKMIRDSLRPRFKWRPYVFRAYFDSQLLVAESRGKIAHDFRVFFMGHKGSIEAKYTTNKAILAEAMVKEMKAAFKRSEEFLDLENESEDPLLKQKEELHDTIEKAAPEKVQEMLRILGVCNS